MALVSVIIPLYNRKQLIERCVQSALCQTHRELEIIIVDDGSTDGCEEELERLAAADSRVRVCHKPNGGVSSARNAGLDMATGEYVQFLDSDDTLLPYAIETTVAEIERSGADAVIFGMRYSEPSATENREVSAPASFSRLEDYFIHCRGLGGLCSPVNKLFRRNRLETLRFRRDVSWGEDMIFSLHYLTAASSFSLLPESLYVVYDNSPGSLTHRYDPRGFHDAQAQAEELFAYTKQGAQEEVQRIIGSYLWLCYMECVRKLCLRSGLPHREVLKTIRGWDASSFVDSVRRYGRLSPLDCRCVSRRWFALVPCAVRWCYRKSRIVRALRGH